MRRNFEENMLTSFKDISEYDRERRTERSTERTKSFRQYEY